MNKFIIIDSAQIEARVLAWVAGQNDLLKSFASGEDVYSIFASTLFNCVVRKPEEEDPEPVAKFLGIKRGFGKDAILGAGFGMGPTKFHERCLQNPDLRPLFDSGEYGFKFIDKLIKTYRKTYYRIPEFWTAIEKSFKWVIKYPKEVVSYHIPDDEITIHGHLKNCKPALKNSLLTFWNDNGTVNLQLPSGRVLYYRHAVASKRGGYDSLKYHHGALWGGTLTENVVQAIARDALGIWILKLEEHGFPVVLHSHDECVCVCQEQQAEEKMRLATGIMSKEIEWAKGLPLDSEGVVSYVYTK